MSAFPVTIFHKHLYFVAEIIDDDFYFGFNIRRDDSNPTKIANTMLEDYFLPGPILSEIKCDEKKSSEYVVDFRTFSNKTPLHRIRDCDSKEQINYKAYIISLCMLANSIYWNYEISTKICCNNAINEYKDKLMKLKTDFKKCFSKMMEVLSKEYQERLRSFVLLAFTLKNSDEDFQKFWKMIVVEIMNIHSAMDDL